MQKSFREKIAEAFFIFLYDFQLVDGGEGRILVLQIIGIPIGNGGNIVLQGEVAVAAAPAQSLHGDLQIGLKIDGIHDVPAVEIEISLGANTQIS